MWKVPCWDFEPSLRFEVWVQTLKVRFCRNVESEVPLFTICKPDSIIQQIAQWIFGGRLIRDDDGGSWKWRSGWGSYRKGITDQDRRPAAGRRVYRRHSRCGRLTIYQQIWGLEVSTPGSDSNSNIINFFMGTNLGGKFFFILSFFLGGGGRPGSGHSVLDATRTNMWCSKISYCKIIRTFWQPVGVQRYIFISCRSRIWISISWGQLNSLLTFPFSLGVPQRRHSTKSSSAIIHAK